jgi:hypothetical protein
MVQRVTDDGPDRLQPGDRDLARRIVADYERDIRASDTRDAGD